MLNSESTQILNGKIYTNLVTKHSYTEVKDKKTNEDLERTQLKKGRQMKTLIEVGRNVVMDYRVVRK